GNAGSFRKGSFEHDPWADTITVDSQGNPVRNAYPGCPNIGAAWNPFYAHKRGNDVYQPYDWKYGFVNYGVRIGQSMSAQGNPFRGSTQQEVTGLQLN